MRRSWMGALLGVILGMSLIYFVSRADTGPDQWTIRTDRAAWKPLVAGLRGEFFELEFGDRGELRVWVTSTPEELEPREIMASRGAVALLRTKAGKADRLWMSWSVSSMLPGFLGFIDPESGPGTPEPVATARESWDPVLCIALTTLDKNACHFEIPPAQREALKGILYPSAAPFWRNQGLDRDVLVVYGSPAAEARPARGALVGGGDSHCWYSAQARTLRCGKSHLLSTLIWRRDSSDAELNWYVWGRFDRAE